MDTLPYWENNINGVSVPPISTTNAKIIRIGFFIISSNLKTSNSNLTNKVRNVNYLYHNLNIIPHKTSS